jgi:hypothetical protein
VREWSEGVRRIEAEDGLWWASLFKDLLTAELDPRGRAEALRRIRQALKLVEEEAADLTDEIIELQHNPAAQDAVHLHRTRRGGARKAGAPKAARQKPPHPHPLPQPRTNLNTERGGVFRIVYAYVLRQAV